MNYREAISYLQTLTDMERDPALSLAPVNFDLGRMESLLRRLGSPHHGRRTVHIAGSKGKGSTATMIARILTAKGHKVGLYTSPHLHRYEERIDVAGKPISSERFAALTELVRPAVEAEGVDGDWGKPSTFEALTAMALLEFAAAGCEIQVLEVGLGGRLDATNVDLGEKLCVITPIGLEHTAILGDTVAAIAGEKAAIIQPGSRVVMAPQRESAAEVVRARCAETDCELLEVATLTQMKLGPATLEGRQVTIRTPGGLYELRLGLLAKEQGVNAAAAIVACELMEESLDPAVVKRAMQDLRLPGRQELIKRQPPILVDVAHSEDSIRSLAQTLRELGAAPLTLVFSPLADKRLAAMAELVAPLCSVVVAAPSPHPRAADVRAITEAFLPYEVGVYQSADFAAGLSLGRELAGDRWLVVAGSFAAVAAARAEVLALAPP
ncbi:MAG: folylpolyglutamate synthase/dihydrofolate synthase family protein [Dehalococcoidia bacterium]